LQVALGIELSLSTAYYLQTNGLTERVNRILEDLLRACILDFGGSWEQHFPLVEFTYNNSYQASIGMAPYEALYGRPCKSPNYWWESTDKLLLGPEMIWKTSDKIELVRKWMKATQDRQKSYADRRRRDIAFSIGDEVFVKVSPLIKVMSFGTSGKLAPRFIGPYEIIEKMGTLAYRVDLPPELSGVHNVFHVSYLRKRLHKTAIVGEPVQQLPFATEPIAPRATARIVEHGIKKLRNKEIRLVRVQWGEDPAESIWEMEEKMRVVHSELFSDNFLS